MRFKRVVNVKTIFERLFGGGSSGGIRGIVRVKSKYFRIRLRNVGTQSTKIFTHRIRSAGFVGDRTSARFRIEIEMERVNVEPTSGALDPRSNVTRADAPKTRPIAR